MVKKKIVTSPLLMIVKLNKLFGYLGLIGLVFFLTLSIFFSCSSDNSSKDQIKFNLQNSSEILLSTTNFFSYRAGNVQFEYLSFEDDQVAVLQTRRNKLEIYDLQNDSLIRSITFALDGPNRLASAPTAFHFISEDSLLVASIESSTLHLFNGKGDKLNQFQLNTYKRTENSVLVPYITGTPLSIHKIGSKVYLPGLTIQGANLEGANQLFEIDLATSEINEILPRPKPYADVYYVVHDFTAVHLAERNNELVLSPIVSNYLELVRGGKSEFHYAGSNFFDSIPFYSANPPEGLNWDIANRETATSPRFSAIYYDKFRDVFYRIAITPPTLDQYLTEKKAVQHYSIITLNRDLKKIGETIIDHEKYDLTGLFISPAGLCIFNNEKYAQNEDQLSFDVFVLEEIKDEQMK